MLSGNLFALFSLLIILFGKKYMVFGMLSKMIDLSCMFHHIIHDIYSLVWHISKYLSILSYKVFLRQSPDTFLLDPDILKTTVERVYLLVTYIFFSIIFIDPFRSILTHYSFNCIRFYHFKLDVLQFVLNSFYDYYNKRF